MAEMPRSIFNEKASNKLRNPDDLDKFVRVTNPSRWVVFAACAALIVGLLAWGVFGTVSTNVGTTGVVIDGTPMCFLSTEDRAQIAQGDIATFGGRRMTVASVAAVPMSKKEAHEVLKNDYLTSTLVKEDWAYQVIFDGDVADLTNNVPLNTNIATERIAPIELLLEGER